jgi:hypothetical protein
MEGIPYLSFVMLQKDLAINVERFVIDSVMKADRLSHNSFNDLFLVSEATGPNDFDTPSDSYMKFLNRHDVLSGAWNPGSI